MRKVLELSICLLAVLIGVAGLGTEVLCFFDENNGRSANIGYMLVYVCAIVFGIGVAVATMKKDD